MKCPTCKGELTTFESTKEFESQSLWCSECYVVWNKQEIENVAAQIEALDRTSAGDKVDKARMALLEAENEQLKDLLKKTHPRPVAVAVIKTAFNYFIITKRRQGQFMAGKWCFPGGKSEPGETIEQTLHREVMEEIGVTVTITKKLLQRYDKSADGIFELHYFECYWTDSPTNKLQPLECDRVEIVDPQMFSAYDMMHVDSEVAENLELKYTLAQVRWQKAHTNHKR